MHGRSIRRARARRIVVGTAAAVTVAAASALPALAHPGFSAAAGFGFAPNTSGGTGAVGSTPPYAPGTTQTLHLRVPFEQTEPFNGSDDTTVDVQVVVPNGWTNPVCGDQRTNQNNAGTNNTNQPNTVVSGWTCAVETANARKVLHWHGPQVQAPATAADSAVWFTFQVTTPSPLAQTTYNGVGFGIEGFIVDQQYASGETEHWIPNAAFPGNPPAGSTTTVAGGLARTVAAAPQTYFTGVQPARILDTRDGTGLSGAFGPGQTRDLTVLNVGGVPADATSVVLNVTVTGTTAGSDLRLWPAGGTQPDASNLNWVAGQTIPNLVKVKVGDGGKVSIRNQAGNAQVIADVVGYYAPTGDGYTGVQPARILDTRDDVGLTDPFGAGETRELAVSGHGGVPAGATAVAMNVTASAPSEASHLTVWPADQTQPNASNLNWAAHQTIPNLVIVKLDADGHVKLRNNSGTVDVVGDVVGYYTSPTPTLTDGFVGTPPARILDTRDGTGLTGAFGPGETREATVTNVGGVPLGATAVVLNVTVTQASAASHLTVWPADQTQPDASSLNWRAGETIPNLVIARVDVDGKIKIRNNSGSVQVIGDVVGFFVPPPAG